MLGLESQVELGLQTGPFAFADVRQALNVYKITGGQTRSRPEDPILSGGFENLTDPTEPGPGLPDHKVTVEVPLCLAQFPYWLRAFFSAPTTTGEDPDLEHAFKTGRALQYASIQHRLQSGDYRRHLGLVGEEMKIGLNPEADGFARVTMTFVGIDEERDTATAADGEVSPEPGLDRPAEALARVLWNAVEGGQLIGGELTFKRNLKRIRAADGTGKPSRIEYNGKSSLSGSVKLRYADQSIIADAWSRTERSMALELFREADRGVRFLCGQALLDETPIGADGPDGVEVDVPVTAYQGFLSPALTITTFGPAAPFTHLSALTVTPDAAIVGEAYEGTISGKTAGSVLSLSGAGAAGLTLDGVEITGTPTAAGDVDIVETLSGAPNSPRTTPNALTTGVAPLMAFQSVMDGGEPGLWLDASDTSTITASAGLVDSLANKGSLGGAATSTGTSRPATGATTINGLNALDMNATHLDISSESWSLPDGPYTLFMVARNDEAGATQRYLLGGMNSASFIFGATLNQSGTANRVSLWLSGTTSSVQAVPTSNQGMLLLGVRGQRSDQVTAGAGRGYGFINGVEYSGYNAARSDVALTAMRLGGIPTGTANRMVGKFCELIVFPRILSIDEHQIVEGYLAAKWGMQSSLQSTHPWFSDDPVTSPRLLNFVCWGDSYTENAWMADADKWVTQLALLTGRQVHNAGKGGEKTDQIRDRKLADDRYFDRPGTYWAGTNGATGPTTVVEDVVAAVGDRPTGKLLVMPAINTADQEAGTAGYITKMANNAGFAAAFPDNYFDVRRRAIDLQLPSGPYPNAEAITKDIMQAELREDSTHWNVIPFSYVAPWVIEIFREKGWLPPA
ncbi:hypothetical protein GVN18_36015 [Pseudomonas sp. ODNR1LW]|nr:hypothetical protein [Pseudomonas sp. ODNR1LW]